MEPKSLEFVFRQYQKELWLYLYSLCKNAALADDHLQETFLKALLSLPNSHTNVRAWLYMVGRNLYFDGLKKEKRLTLQEDMSREADKTCVEEKLIENETNRALYKNLSGLDVKKREILTLYYFSGLSQKEIARILNLRPDYVRVLALRAKRELKQRMEAEGYDLS